MQGTEKIKNYSQVFPEFQKFIVSRGFVPESKARYFAWWVKRFELYPVRESPSTSLRTGHR